MSTFKKSITDKLLDFPWFRERKHKDEGIVRLLAMQYPILKQIPTIIFVSIVQDYGSMDRTWRKILEENPNLRGNDYEDKEMLEQQKQLDLGYEVGYAKDIKNNNQ